MSFTDLNTAEDGTPVPPAFTGPTNEDGTPTLPEDSQGVITSGASGDSSASGYSGPASFSAQNNVGGFIADCVMSESHTDELTITQHPVEQGASISDHAYANPVRVVVRMGYSNSSSQAGGDANYVNSQYQNLLALQKARTLIKVTTTKRQYKNMLVQALSTETTDEFTNSGIIVVTLQEIIQAQTQTTTVAPASQQANPANTAAPVQRGVVAPTPATPNQTAII